MWHEWGGRGMLIGYWWKETIRKTRRRWVYNVKMDLGEIGWGGMDWIDLVQDMNQRRALVNMAVNLRVLQNSGNFLSSCTTDGLICTKLVT
jgi:hypothetical protein